MDSTPTPDRLRIPLYDRSGDVVGWTVVSPDDRDLVRGRMWRLNGGYAKSGRLFLHRVVLGLGPGEGSVDHINGDGLDNRRENLRVATHAQNMQNRRPHKNARTSRFRAVYRDADSGRWRARCRLNNRPHHLGYFDTELEAAAAVAEFLRVHMPYAQPDPAYIEAIADLGSAA